VQPLCLRVSGVICAPYSAPWRHRDSSELCHKEFFKFLNSTRDFASDYHIVISPGGGNDFPEQDSKTIDAKQSDNQVGPAKMIVIACLSEGY